MLDDVGEDPLLPEETAALLEVFGRRRGEPFGVEPVLRELVEAVLKTQFGSWQEPTPFDGAMAAVIAQTLYEDPRCRERLSRFWLRLSRELP